MKVTEEVRQQMLSVLLEIHRIKKYKEETLYLAVSLADRYLWELIKIGHRSPCLILLSLICMLMAAKMEEPVQPSFNLMVNLA